MPMSNKGLNKLMEECGELIAVAAKKAAYIDTDTHPDGKGSLKQRMEEEIADVIAACSFVVDKFKLDINTMERRTSEKLHRFNEWDKDPNS